MVITKSKGVTPTEELLSNLCDRTFLKLWSYPNPCKDDGKELCDLIAVFENHVFIFFDRESRKFDNTSKAVLVSWKRWKREVVDKQIKTAQGATRYIESRRLVYLDEQQKDLLPIQIRKNSKIYQIVVAHGAEEACRIFSPENIFGSLAISYSALNNERNNNSSPFMVNLDKSMPVHIFDSHNLQLIFEELDTVYDFTMYLKEKELAIKKYDLLLYVGEEDLLAHYLGNFNPQKKKYWIGTTDKSINALFIEEGEWQSFENSEIYRLRKDENDISYQWDHLLQVTCQNALDGTYVGTSSLLQGKSAVIEMAKEPRFVRRFLSMTMKKAVGNFPENEHPYVRNLTFMESFYKETGYVFLQFKAPKNPEYRAARTTLLEISCGVIRNKFPHLKKIIGIGIEPPKFSEEISEDFILLECEEWSNEDKQYYQEKNKVLHLFETQDLKRGEMHITDFPVDPTYRPKRKIGRNEACFCGSGKKYKKCCI